jgi:hypothetical protein
MGATDRPKFNVTQARNTILGGLSRKADSDIFSAFGVTPELDRGRLKYQGMTADQYASQAIRGYDESELESLASSLGIRIK